MRQHGCSNASQEEHVANEMRRIFFYRDFLMSYETQQMYSRYLPSFLTLLSYDTSFISVLVTYFILFDVSVHVFALSCYSHLNHEI